jgi:hypothetical protein
MRRFAAILALVLGLTLLAAPPASAAVAAHAENRASGSTSDPNNLIGIETWPSAEAVRENAGPGYDLASDDAVAARSVEQAGADLARAAGRNRVSARTAGGKQVDIDLAGSEHFDKATGRAIPTPHVREAKINVGPNGKTNLSDKTVRPATMEDIRTARKILERE